MYGYVYKTTNDITGEVYIGMHKGDKFDEYYYGSGSGIRKSIKEYGKENFSREMICSANSKDELCIQERKYIADAKETYGDKCLNRGIGGEGGDTIAKLTPEEYEAFVEKMTKINRERCATSKFKEQISKAVIKRYEDPSVRKAQSEKAKATWSDPKLRQEQSERIKKSFAEKGNPRDVSTMYKPCVLELNGETKNFESVKDLRSHLKNKYRFNPDRRSFKKYMEMGANGEGIHHLYKNKYEHIDGMIIKYVDQNESVSTNGDECSQEGGELVTTQSARPAVYFF